MPRLRLLNRQKANYEGGYYLLEAAELVEDDGTSVPVNWKDPAVAERLNELGVHELGYEYFWENAAVHGLPDAKLTVGKTVFDVEDLCSAVDMDDDEPLWAELGKPEPPKEWPARSYPDEDLGPPGQVTMFEGYGIFADYDANAPDTEDLLLCATEALAKEVCGILNADPRRWGNLAFVEGYEWCKSFGYHPAYDRDPEVFGRSVAAVMANVEEDDGDGDGDGDGEDD